jgi:hypothetical protein
MAIAVLLAFLFAMLGIISGLGYHRNSLEQLYFQIHPTLGYADATISFSATYDPLLYPFYWIKGMGYENGTFSFQYIPNSYGPGEFSGGNYGLKPSDRFDDYTMRMILWGFWANLIALLFVTVFIEAAKARILYIAMFFGLFGFFVDVLPGMIAGLVIGVVVVWFITFKLPKDNVLSRFWYSLWE